MKKLLITLLFLTFVTSNAFAFQSEVGGVYLSSDHDGASSSTIGVVYNYYVKPLAYGAAPYKELSFLSSDSSIGFVVSKSDYKNSNVSDAILFGIKSVIYQENFALDLTILSGTVDSNSLPGSSDYTSIGFEPGIRLDKSSLLFLIYMNNTLESADSTSKGIGFKNVTDDMSVVAQYADNKESAPGYSVKSSNIALVVDFYMSNNQFIGFEYDTTDYAGSSDDSTSKTIAIGGLISQSASIEFSYSESDLADGSSSNQFTFVFTMSF